MRFKNLALLATTVFLLGACGNNEQNSSENTEQTSSEQQDSSEVSKVGINEPLTVNTENGTAELTITEATRDRAAFPDHLSYEGSNFDIDKGAIFTIEYKNVDIDEGFVLSSYELQLFDKDGKQVTTESDSYDSVGVGRTGVMTFWAELPEENTNVEIDYVPESKPLGTIIVEIN